MLITVCIATVRPTTLGATIASIRDQTWTNWELVVVGQGHDRHLEAVTRQAADQDQRVRYIHLPTRGLSAARNAAVKAARGDILAFTDDDCEARADWMATVAQCFMDDPELGFVGGSVEAPKSRRHWLANCPNIQPGEVLYDPRIDPHQAPTARTWIGANFAIRREVADRVGPFDECLGGGAAFPGFEEIDYCWRMEALGVKMRTTPRSVIHHTYGYRYGPRAVYRNKRNYAEAAGGFIGKLFLQGDPRGKEFLQATRNDCLNWIKRKRPQHLPVSLLRLWYVTQAYRRCLREFQVDKQHGLLKLRESRA